MIHMTKSKMNAKKKIKSVKVLGCFAVSSREPKNGGSVEDINELFEKKAK